MLLTDLIYEDGLFWIVAMDNKFLVCKGNHLIEITKSFDEAKQIIRRLADEQS